MSIRCNFLFYIMFCYFTEDRDEEKEIEICDIHS